MRRELHSESLPALLLLCSDLADSTPLLYLVEEAGRMGLVFDDSLGEVFLQIPTASLQKLLQLPGLEISALSAWAQAEVEQLVAFALLDRYLRRRVPALWREGLDRVARETRAKLESKERAEERLILRLEGREQRRLQAQFSQAWLSWDEAWAETARKAVRCLAARPRDVSLANAERLLSQQVYTDQGHFLLELLQNADDAGASRFEVHFLSDQVVVYHDGEPFDFRDLVGVLSIGQTTKTERQIGYFGVGFKSVFEVSERPRLQSGYFAFEIVDVSVPRSLLLEPRRSHLTTLSLPLKEGMTALPFYQRALAIEPTLLLNLPHVKTLHWLGPDGTETTLSQSQNGDIASLSRDDRQEDYLLWRCLYRHQGERPEGKPKEAEVILAFPLNGDGSIPPVNLYSFLPIQENSGLRFLVGSHFDVPVDRERLDPNSDWNRGIASMLADLIEERCQASPPQLLSILGLLPLAEDAVGPLFRCLFQSLAERLRDIAFLPSEKQGLKKAVQAVVLEDDLLPLFDSEELQRFVLPADEKSRTWLGVLGARTYGVKALLLDLVRGRAPRRLSGPGREFHHGLNPGCTASPASDFSEAGPLLGEKSDAGDTAGTLWVRGPSSRRNLRPGPLMEKELQIWSHFHKLLLQDPSFETWGTQLRAVPLLLDQSGELVAAKDLWLLREDWENVFEEAPRTVLSALRALPETEALLASLDIETYDWQHLVAHLQHCGLEGIQTEQLFRHLVKAPKAIQMACLQLPLFPSQDGDLRPLTRHEGQPGGLLVARAEAPLELFSELSFCLTSEPLESLLGEVNWPYFDRPEALAYLARRNWRPETHEAELLRRWVLSKPSHWAKLEDLEHLAALQVFESSLGPLKSLHQLWLFEDPELSTYLPDLPQLKEGSSSQELVSYFGLDYMLQRAALDTLIETMDEEQVALALPFLSRRAKQLTWRQIAKLLARPLYRGRSVANPENPPGPECVEVAESAFVDLFRELGWKVADRAFTEQVIPLMKAAGYPLLGLQDLLGHLRSVRPPAELLPAVHELLLSKALEIDSTYSERFLQSLPLWLCQDGEVRAAEDIPPDSELGELLELSGRELLSPRSARFEELFPLLEPSEFLLRRLNEDAFMGVVLGAQPSWLQTVEQVDRVASTLSRGHLCVNASEQLCDRRLFFAPPESHPWLSRSDWAGDLLHPSSSPWQANRAFPISPGELLEAFLPFLQEEPMRLSFYSYLENQLSQILRDSWAKDALLKAPLWRSAVGTFLPLNKLVMEGGLADLGYDWFPHGEIPETLLEQLKLAFDLGHSDSATVLRNLLRAYLVALEERRGCKSLLSALSKIAENLSATEVKQALYECMGEGDFPLWDEERNTSHSLAFSYAPPSPLSPLTKLTAVRAEWVDFLRKVGLPYYPHPSALQAGAELSPEDSRALEDLIAWVWEERPGELERDIPSLRALPWMRNRAGQLKAPVQLYLPSSEIEDLIGSSPDLYPASQRPLGFWRTLGLREQDALGFPQVLPHLQRQISAGHVLGSHFYHYLENSLARGSLNPLFLKSSLDGLAWIWTDEGEHREAKEVLGFPAYRYFGPHRGTWERAHKRFPHLSRLFEIPESLDSRSILEFLEQVNDGKFPHCSHRLIKNGLAYLLEQGVALPRHWAVLPARQFPDLGDRLVAAETPGVVMSNSPTLAALFGQGGTLWVVETDEPEHGEAMRALCRELGIPDLREAYTVRPDASGLDLTEQLGESLVSFRELLRALDQVLPRLRAARSEWGEGEWSVETRLRPFATTAPIRVLEPLELIYSLGQVSTVRVTAAMAFDPEGQRLLVSARALQEPQVYALELAEGLAECIYQGSGSESLVDLLNLLLLFGSDERMNSYLDQRHFPRPLVESGQGSEVWRRRLGEILDFGIQQALARRFPELEGANWEAWRDPRWSPQHGGADEVLERLGLSSPSEDLLQTFREILAAPVLRLPSVERLQEQAAPGALPENSQTSLQESEEGSAPNVSRLTRFSKQLLSRFAEIFVPGSSAPRTIGLEYGRQDPAESYRNPPERHLLVSSRELSGHNLYCLNSLCSEFDALSQEYRPAWKRWNPIFLPSGERVEFSGAPSSPRAPLPLPLYSKLQRAPRLEGMTLSGPDHFSQYQLTLPGAKSRITYQVELSALPEFQNSPPLTEDMTFGLLAPTTKLQGLPRVLLDWIEWANNCGMAHWQLAEKALQFVKSNYKYDLHYFESEQVQAVIASPLRAGENRFLSLLHAGGSEAELGRGRCTELSAVLLEILRHCGVPSALASVWVLDEGLIHFPDHVVALALLPSSAGPYWLPLDPSVQRMGSPHRQLAEEQTLTRLQVLEKAASVLLDNRMKFPDSPEQRQRLLEEVLANLFGKSELLELFLECLVKPGRYRKNLSPGFLELHERGFLEIKSEEVYQIWVREQV